MRNWLCRVRASLRGERAFSGETLQAESSQGSRKIESLGSAREWVRLAGSWCGVVAWAKALTRVRKQPSRVRLLRRKVSSGWD